MVSIYFRAYLIHNKSVKGIILMNHLENIISISSGNNEVLRTSEVVIVLWMYGEMNYTYYSLSVRKQSFPMIQRYFSLI